MLSSTERRLATLEKIASITPIDGADNIEIAKVREWEVVVRKGEFAPGALVVYFEIDTALPLATEHYTFLEARSSRLMDGDWYHILKTVRLRGVYSQGLVLSATEFTKEIDEWAKKRGKYPEEGDDLTEPLDLKKWEPDPPNSGGEPAGNFPLKFVMKTDSERAQNLGRQWENIQQYNWIATEKVDGCSCTVVNTGLLVQDEDGEYVENDYTVCSRNWQVRDGDNLYWRTVREYNLMEPLQVGESVQFEIAGPGIQKNRLGLEKVRPFIFGYFRNGKAMPRTVWPDIYRGLAVPEMNVKLPATIAEAVDQADGIKSVVSPGRLAEGIVWHTQFGEVPLKVGRPNFKVISNKYLLKGE